MSKIKCFLKGFGSVLNIGNSHIKNPLENSTDRELLYQDWKNVGNDLTNALRKAKHETRTRQKY